jgi:hypothetical protein
MFRNKIFIILFLFCSISIFAVPTRFSEKIAPMDRFGLNAEYLTSSKTRAVDSLNCELVGGWFRGPSYAVCIVDTLVYLGAGQSLKILNVKDSTEPILIGEIIFPSGFVYDIFVKDTLAYVADIWEGFRVIDVSDPSSPAEIGFCETPGDTRGVWIQGTLAYVADADRGLCIIDISDPSNPVMVGSYHGPWYAIDVFVRDTIAYVAGNGLRIINVSDPSSPDSMSVFNDTLSIYSVYIRDTLAYIAGDENYDSLFMSIINVVDPSSPIEVGSYYLNLDLLYSIYEIWDIWVQDSFAYLAVGSSTVTPDSCGLYIVNVADPTSIKEVGNYLTGGGSAQDVCVKDNLAYISCRNVSYYDPEGLIIIDVSDPSLPTGVGEYDTGSRIRGVWVKDSFAYVANSGRGLNIINVSDPSFPFEIGFCNTRSVAGPRDVWVQDTFAYVADGDSGLCIINIASPSFPKEVGFYDTPYWALDVYLQDTLAYVADGDSGLRIINVANPSVPTEIGFYHTRSWTEDVWVQDTLAYLASDSLYIINISDPSLPVEVGSLPGEFVEIFIKDTLAFIVGDDFHIIDVSDPSLPVEVGFCNTPGEYNEGVWVQGNLAYVANVDSGLRIIDVSDPSSPSEVGFFNLGDAAVDVYVQDSLIYVAYWYGGLYIVKYTGPYGGIEELTTERDEFNISNISNTIEINYSVVSNEEKIKIEIFNILGQKVGCLVNGTQARGNYTLNWSGKTGIYFVRMEIGEKVYRQKVLLVK